MNERNVCIAGIPRAGTTLTCQQLNRLPDILALHEPMRARRLVKAGSPEKACRVIHQFFEDTRRTILTQGVVEKKQPQLGRSLVKLGRELSEPFTLCLKQPAAFTGLLEHLVRRFPCYAVIRNPAATLGSWNKVTMPVRDGHSPAAEKLDPALAESLAGIDDILERQIHLLEWYFQKIARWLPADRIIQYEDIVESGGKCLSVVIPSAADLDSNLRRIDCNRRYGAQTMRKVCDRLLRTEGTWWQFYTRESVQTLIPDGELDPA